MGSLISTNTAIRHIGYPQLPILINTQSLHEQQAIFDQGNQVGLLAQELFPGGLDSSPSSHFKMMESVITTASSKTNGAWKVLA